MASGRSSATTRRRPNEAYFAARRLDRRTRPTRSASTSGCCRRGATSGTRSGASARRSSRPRTRRPTASGSAARYRDAGIVWILGGDRPVEIRRAPRHHRGDGARPPRRRRRRAPDHLPSHRRAELRRRGSTTTTGSTSTCGRTATSPSSPAATTRRASTTTARRSSPSSMASRSTRTIRSRSTRREFGHSIAADVRRPLYWNLFTGAFGHTYGHHSVWQMWTPGRTPVNNPLLPWQRGHRPARRGADAARAGAARVAAVSHPHPGPRRSSRPRSPTSMPGAGRYHFAVDARRRPAATRWSTRRSGRTFSVRMSAITGPTVKAWWFNPRTGTATAIGTFPQHRRARLHAARRRRDARLGAGARRRSEGISAPGVEGRRLARNPATEYTGYTGKKTPTQG